MDKNIDYGGFAPYGNFDIGMDPNNPENSMFNPMIQYEQAYMYYRYLSKQMEYKIRCKEYEKLCGGKERRVE